jgi:CheY-like chemotaxis protein
MNSPRILVVDDDRAVLRFLTATLVRAGFGVVSSSSGQEAATFLDIGKFDLLILDLDMSGEAQDGFEILKSARKQKDLWILVLSGFLRGPLLEAARLLGAVATLPKPVTKPDLIAKVEEILSGG